jgi:S-DNA-T family DNA segregation ATPase FtsK/SpoIIIE
MGAIYGDKEAPPLYVCHGCQKLGGRDLFVWWRKRCPLCGRLTEKFTLEGQGKSEKNKKFLVNGKWIKSKDIQRFPRELAANPEQKRVVDIITERSRDFDCPGKVIEIRQGPMVTEYKFQPDRFTRLYRIKNINEDLAIALSAESVTVQRIPGEAAIGVSIPNAERKTILFDDCLKNVIAHKDDMELPINFGVTATGEPFVEDLVRLPHLLVAGSTGAGKSVFLNNVLCSLLYIRSPKQLKLILIDPKSVELFPYKGLPHMMMDPVASVYDALSQLDRMVQEMKRRTSNLNFAKVKNIQEYNAKMKAEGHPDDQWPYIMIVIDEMADLVLQEKKTFTEKMASISAMARAAGIHVIAATQRPSVDVLSGKVKVNFPARIAFRVPSQADSKTILGHKGAEQLLGRGDMFYISPEKSGMQRLHAPLTTQPDVTKMLEMSVKIGHVLNVPADGLSETPIGTAVPELVDEADTGKGKKNGKQMTLRVN